ncbi:transcriptional regulator [Alteromonas phage vB_AmaS-R9Y1]|nr:transcriptional regulator [Alteromonas phage vB_AmaS-R9Y1]
MKKRFKPEVRKEQIIDAAIGIVEGDGFAALDRQTVARVVGVSGQTINHYFGTLKQLERAVKRAAIAKPSYSVIAQLIVMKDATVENLDEGVKRKALGGFL